MKPKGSVSFTLRKTIIKEATRVEYIFLDREKRKRRREKEKEKGDPGPWGLVWAGGSKEARVWYVFAGIVHLL